MAFLVVYFKACIFVVWLRWSYIVSCTEIKGLRLVSIILLWWLRSLKKSSVIIAIIWTPLSNDRSDHSNKDRWDSDCSNSNLTILGCTAFPTVKHFWKISGTQSLWVIVFHVIFKPESMIHSCHIEFDKWHEQCSLFTFSVTAAINWKSSIATIAQPSKLLQQS